MSTVAANWGSRYRLFTGRHIRVHQLTAMGFDHVREMLFAYFDVPAHDGTVIVLGDYIFHPAADFRSLYPGARLVIYQLEQMIGAATWHPVDRTIAHLHGADEIWDYDDLNVEFLRWHKVTVDRVVPMLWTADLRRVPLQDEPRIDLLFTGYVNERRHRILQKIQQSTYGRARLMWLQGVEGPDLDAYIGDAKIILNMHAFEPYHRQEQTRIFYPLINDRMVLSEPSERNVFGNCIVEASEDRLGQVLLHWLAEDRWRAFGPAAGEHYRRWTEAWLAEQDDVAPMTVAPPRPVPAATTRPAGMTPPLATAGQAPAGRDAPGPGPTPRLGQLGRALAGHPGTTPAANPAAPTGQDTAR